MAIKKSKYNIHNGADYDTYHFETQANQVQVIDSNGDSRATLDELLFKGKKITSGSVDDIKKSGLYRIKNVTHLPAGMPQNEYSLLSVQAIGDETSPDIIYYRLIDKYGNILTRVDVAGRKSAWKNGGVNLENALRDIRESIGSIRTAKTRKNGTVVEAINELYDSIQSIRGTIADNEDLGDINTLRTGTKSNVVSALNEIVGKISALKLDVDATKNQMISLSFNNYDDRYLRLSGEGTVSGIRLSRNGIIHFVSNGGELSYLIRSLGDAVVVGDRRHLVNIQGSGDLLYNDKKVWTQDNDGQYSGLDADLLDGKHANEFIQKGDSNYFSEKQMFNDIKVKNIELSNDYKLTINHSGNFGVVKNNNSIFEISNNGIEGEKMVLSGDGDTSVSFKRSKDRLGGFSFVRSHVNGDFSLYNNEVGKEVFTVEGDEGVARFNEYIVINGKRLYIQSNEPPTDPSVPEGSIWLGGSRW